MSKLEIINLFSASGKTKYFAVQFNKDCNAIVKMSSKKMAARIINILETTKDPQFTLNNRQLTISNEELGVLTKESFIVLNHILYLLNNKKQTQIKNNEESSKQQQTICKNVDSSAQSEYNSTSNAVYSDTRSFRAGTTSATVYNSSWEQSTSTVFSTAIDKYDCLESPCDFRVLPSDPHSFRSPGEIDSRIEKLARQFYYNEPGAQERVNRLKLELQFCLATGLVTPESNECIEELFRVEVGRLQLIDERTDVLQKQEQQFRELEQNISVLEQFAIEFEETREQQEQDLEQAERELEQQERDLEQFKRESAERERESVERKRKSVERLEETEKLFFEFEEFIQQFQSKQITIS
jgi:hypothetical protein